MVIKTAVQHRTPEEAVEELIALHTGFDGDTEGERLTHEFIRDQVGVSQTPSVSKWFNKHHYPKGATFRNLCAFLDKAKDKTWLKKEIKKFYEKKRQQG